VSRDALFLSHMTRACEKIATYIDGGKEAFYASEMIQDAVLRNLETTKNLSQAMRDQASDQPWRQIAGMRDKLIHDYFGVNLDRVWATASTILPPFRARIAELLAQTEREDLEP